MPPAIVAMVGKDISLRWYSSEAGRGVAVVKVVWMVGFVEELLHE